MPGPWRPWALALPAFALALALVLPAQAGALGVPSLARVGLPDGPGDASATVPAPVPATVPRLVRVDAIHAAWTIDLGLSLAAGKGVTTPASSAKSACAIGDVDGDGHADLLVKHAPGKNAAHAKFEALAGPGFTRSLWTAEPRDARLLKCGSDVTGDGVADPIAVAAPDPAPADVPVPATPAAASSASTTAVTPLDGGTGAALAEIAVETGSTTVGGGGGGIVPAAGSAGSGDVVPAGTDALLVVATTTTGADLGGPLAPASPARDGAVLEVVDASGAVQGSITLPATADAVAAAPLPAAEPGGLPDVVVLSETDLVPADGVPFGVPEVALHGGDGSAQWAVRQEATTGVPVLLPDAGDVDGDGVGDLVYATVPPAVAAAPAAGYEVVSGADGSTILSSGEPRDGLATALPLGDVDAAPGATDGASGDGADEVLVVTQPAGGGDLTLEAIGADGQAEWAAQVPGDAVPVNTATDAAGNVVGFTDLTGDGVPDVAVASPAPGGGTAVTVLDGTDGSVAWTAEVAGAQEVAAVPGLDGGAAQDLVAAGTGTGAQGSSGVTVVSLDGASGAVVWETVAPASGPAGAAAPTAASVTPAGDADGDGVGDLLVVSGAAAADGSPDPDAPGAAHIVSGETGEPLATVATGGAGLAPAPQGTSADGGGAAWPWLLAVAAAAAVALLAMGRRRRRKRGAGRSPE